MKLHDGLVGVRTFKSMDFHDLLQQLREQNSNRRWQSPDPWLSQWIRKISAAGSDVFNQEAKAELNRLELKNSHGSTINRWKSPDPHIDKFADRFESILQELNLGKSGISVIEIRKLKPDGFKLQ